MILRKAIPAESAMLAAIHAEAFGREESWGSDALSLMLEAEGGFGVLAFSGPPPFGEEPLGFALGRAAGGEAEILTIAVRPAAARKGVGRALLEALRQAAQARGASALFLEVAEGNAPALALYHAAGAEPVGRRKRYYADGADALVLRFSLFSG